MSASKRNRILVQGVEILKLDVVVVYASESESLAKGAGT